MKNTSQWLFVLLNILTGSDPKMNFSEYKSIFQIFLRRYGSRGGPIEFSLLNRSLQCEIEFYLVKIEVYFMKSKFILSNQNLFIKSKFIL